MPLNGPAYECDNRMIYCKLKQFLIGTDGYAWIEDWNDTEDGRAAFMSWSNHYNGKGELSKRTTLAKASIDSLYYVNECSLSFEKYTGMLSRAFTILEKDPNLAYSDKRKVEKLLNGI